MGVLWKGLAISVGFCLGCKRVDSSMGVGLTLSPLASWLSTYSLCESTVPSPEAKQMGPLILAFQLPKLWAK